MRITVQSILLAGAVLAAPTALLAAGMTTVVQKGRAFDTAAISIHPGDTIRFSNEDTYKHQVYVEGGFHSDEQATGSKVDIPFPAAGVFNVLCEIHPRMRLRVEVR